MLTGEVPFRSPHLLAALNERLLNNPEPPSRLNPEIPDVLERVVLEALEREPTDRYDSASEFARALENPSEFVKTNVLVLDRRVSVRKLAPAEKAEIPYYLVLIIPAVIFGLLLLAASKP
jgi:eukaryotic-like serine/threonine-protein kinase